MNSRVFLDIIIDSLSKIIYIIMLDRVLYFRSIGLIKLLCFEKLFLKRQIRSKFVKLLSLLIILVFTVHSALAANLRWEIISGNNICYPGDVITIGLIPDGFGTDPWALSGSIGEFKISQIIGEGIASNINLSHEFNYVNIPGQIVNDGGVLIKGIEGFSFPFDSIVVSNNQTIYVFDLLIPSFSSTTMITIDAIDLELGSIYGTLLPYDYLGPLKIFVPVSGNTIPDLVVSHMNISTELDVLSNDLPNLELISFTQPRDINTNQLIGDLTEDAQGKFTFSPPDGYVGTVFFSYTATDGSTQSTEDVTIKITNFLPTFYGNLGDVPMDTEVADVNLLNFATDTPDNGIVDSLFIESSGTITSVCGALLLFDGTGWIYIPADGYVGLDEFVVEIWDGQYDYSSGVRGGKILVDGILTVHMFYDPLFVDDDANNDPGPNDPYLSDPYEDGTQEHPFDSIQEAINVAFCDNKIVVAEGIYTGDGNRDIDFLGKAITVSSVDPNDPDVAAATIIDCNATSEDQHRGFYFHNGEDSNSVLNGLTIRNGYTRNGGGIYCHSSSPTLVNCIITSNTAHYSPDQLWGGGGGIKCMYSNSKFINCVISNNTASGPFSDGGGIYTNSDITLLNCIITGNSTEFFNCDGAGMYNNYANSTLINCIISNNSANGDGAGIYNVGSALTLNNCLITANSAIDERFSGGGIYNNNSNCTLTNCTVTANTGGALKRGNAGQLQLTNCIVWGNTSSGLSPSSSRNTVNYSCIQDWTGDDNICDDPRFVEQGYWDLNNVWVDGDYHLLPDSPCIDFGDPNYQAEPNETNLDGNLRVINGRVDIGAYEFVPPVEVVMYFTPQTLNCKSNGKWVKAHLVLPAEFQIGDVDVSRPLMVEGLVIESGKMDVFLNEEGLVAIEGSFSRDEFCGSIRHYGVVEISVAGFFKDGRKFYGTDTIRIPNEKLERLAILASHWLEKDCEKSKWCGGSDVNHDGVIDFADFALLDGNCR